MSKATAKAPSNLAFVKYWGRKDEELRLPVNGSISMNLSNLFTTTTVEFLDSYIEDKIEIIGIEDERASQRVIKHIDRVRALAGTYPKVRVRSQNNFPSDTGLSSSASSFAALSLAASKAIGLMLTERKLSILARQGSGSACRSIPGGYVEWLDGDSSNESYAETIYSADHWNLIDLVVVVSDEKKKVSSSEGQERKDTSVFFETRLRGMKRKVKQCKKYISEKNFRKLGELTESEALEMHAIMLTSKPSLIYWTPGTLKIMKLVQKWRERGLEAYFSINTGQDVHIICQEKDISRVKEALKKESIVKQIIVNKPCEGASLINEHLF